MYDVKVYSGTIAFALVAALSIGSYAVSDVAGYGVEIADYTGFFDSYGKYVVVGAVNNYESHYVVPRITISVLDGDTAVTKSFLHTPVPPTGEMPFRVALDVSDRSPTILEPEVSYTAIQMSPASFYVIYDQTLVVHDDGTLTGRVINGGIHAVHGVSVFAVVHGEDDQMLDVVRNADHIDIMEPGEIVEFSMTPDPAVSDLVSYYSCFGVTESTVRPVYTERNNDRFYYRYESSAGYSYQEFNEDGTELRMRVINNFPLGTYANFEFPMLSEDEKFAVYVNGEQKDILQSVDETGSWHVVFEVEPLENGEVLFTGFAEGWEVGDRILIPDWMKYNSLQWSEEAEGSEEAFLNGVRFLIDEGIINAEKGAPDDAAVPQWLKKVAGYWGSGAIGDPEFVRIVEYLVNAGIVRV